MDSSDIRRSRLKVGHRFYTGWKVGKYAFVTDHGTTFAWGPKESAHKVPWTMAWRPKGVGA